MLFVGLDMFKLLSKINIDNFKKIANYLTAVWLSFYVDSKSRIFIKYCLKRWPRIDDKTRKSIVLLELYPLGQTVLAFSYFSNIRAEKYQLKIIGFS